MTKKDAWMQLFQDNDAALVCAVYLSKKYSNEELPMDFVQSQMEDLNKEATEDELSEILGREYIEPVELKK